MCDYVLDLEKMKFDELSTDNLLFINAGGFFDGLIIFAEALVVGATAIGVACVAPVITTVGGVVIAGSLIASQVGLAVGGGMMLGVNL